MMLAVDADGHRVDTVEGLSDGNKLHPIQQAYLDEGAVQCGFCTPGFIMSTKALLDKNPNPNEAEIREYLNGNICRCTGYVNIVKAVQSAAVKMKE
jgi:carbon-monoxide dehydrogenase small subunit